MHWDRRLECIGEVRRNRRLQEEQFADSPPAGMTDPESPTHQSFSQSGEVTYCLNAKIARSQNWN